MLPLVFTNNWMFLILSVNPISISCCNFDSCSNRGSLGTSILGVSIFGSSTGLGTSSLGISTVLGTSIFGSSTGLGTSILGISTGLGTSILGVSTFGTSTAI